MTFTDECHPCPEESFPLIPMSALTTRQRDILRLLLDAGAPLPATDLAQKMHLTPRQVNYGLKGLKQWLAQRQISLKTTPGVGVALNCSPEQVESLLCDLQAGSNLQLILKPEQRQQLLALFLLDAGEPHILQQLEKALGVSRTTVSADLDAIEAWLERHGLNLERRPNYGIEISGDEQRQRQALAALSWGDTRLGTPLIELSHSNGLSFALVKDTHLLPIARRTETIIGRWDVQRLFGHVAYAETQLGGRFSDDAVLFLALIFAIQTSRIDRGRQIREKGDEFAWLRNHAVWPVAEEMARRLYWGVGAPWPETEVAYIARYLLAVPRNERWPDDVDINGAFEDLIDQLMEHVSAGYGLPALKQDKMLRDAIVVHIVPAYLRQRFGLWMPAPLPNASLSEQYAFEHQLAQELAQQVEAHLGAKLPQEDVNSIALLLRAAYIRERPYRLRDLIVICPSGIASAQLLVARLNARFPRLGEPRVLSVRELTRRHVEKADLVVTTIPLPPGYDDYDNILQVHPLLFPEDVEAITAWLSSR